MKKPITLSITKVIVDGKPSLQLDVDGTSEEHKAILIKTASNFIKKFTQGQKKDD